jgi:hypothetical protein
MKDLYGADIGHCKVTKKKKIHSGYRIRYRVAGWRQDKKWKSLQDKKWKSLIEGVVSTRDSGNTFFNHLSLLQDVLKNSEARFLFPLPIAYFPQIATVFTGSMEGKPFLSLLGTSEIMRATDKLAKALYKVHYSTENLPAEREIPPFPFNSLSPPLRNRRTKKNASGKSISYRIRSPAPEYFICE